MSNNNQAAIIIQSVNKQTETSFAKVMLLTQRQVPLLDQLYLLGYLDCYIDRCIGRCIDRILYRLSTDMSIHCRPRVDRCFGRASTDVGRRIDRDHIGRLSVNYRRDISQLSANMSILWYRSTYQPIVGQYHGS